MQKITFFTFVFVFLTFAACKGKKAGDKDNPDMQDTMSNAVETGASEMMNHNAELDSVFDRSSDDELFGTDVDDKDVDKATRKK